MIIDCISDLHGHYPELEGGDLLIIAGDITEKDSIIEWGIFYAWLDKQDYRKMIMIGGNHDRFLEQCIPTQECKNLGIWDTLYEDDEKPIFPNVHNKYEYLCDSDTEFEGLKIWGSPWTPWFHGIHPDCKVFTGNVNKLNQQFALIPRDIDILVTHGPPFGIFDDVGYDNVGSPELRNKVLDGSWFHNLKLHVFGHIHECGGKVLETTLCKFVNCAIMNEYYEPTNKPVRIIL